MPRSSLDRRALHELHASTLARAVRGGIASARLAREVRNIQEQAKTRTTPAETPNVSTEQRPQWRKAKSKTRKTFRKIARKLLRRLGWQ